MRGSLSIMQPEPGWKNFFGQRQSVNIRIKGSNDLQLIFQRALFKNEISYSLYNHNGESVRYWELIYRRMETDLPQYGSYTISRDPKITFQQLSHEGLPLIIYKSEKANAVFNVSGSKRRFKFQDIEVYHKDHESEVNFRAPDNKLYEAILIANMLHNPTHLMATG